MATDPKLGLLRVSLRDLHSDVRLLATSLINCEPALDLSAAAFAQVLGLTVPEEIRNDESTSALVAALESWFADVASGIVEHRRPLLEPARAHQRVLEANARERAEREANAGQIEEDRRMRAFEQSHPAYASWARSRMQTA